MLTAIRECLDEMIATDPLTAPPLPDNDINQVDQYGAALRDKIGVANVMEIAPYLLLGVEMALEALGTSHDGILTSHYGEEFQLCQHETYSLLNLSDMLLKLVGNGPKP